MVGRNRSLAATGLRSIRYALEVRCVCAHMGHFILMGRAGQEQHEGVCEGCVELV